MFDTCIKYGKLYVGADIMATYINAEGFVVNDDEDILVNNADLPVLDSVDTSDDDDSELVLHSPGDFLNLLSEGKSLIQACKLCGMSMGDLQCILSDKDSSASLQSLLSSKYVGIDMIALDNLAHDVVLGDPRAISLWLKTRIPHQSNVTVKLVRE